MLPPAPSSTAATITMSPAGPWLAQRSCTEWLLSGVKDSSFQPVGSVLLRCSTKRSFRDASAAEAPMLKSIGSPVASSTTLKGALAFTELPVM